MVHPDKNMIAFTFAVNLYITPPVFSTPETLVLFYGHLYFLNGCCINIQL